jgi:hypothetical protein
MRHKHWYLATIVLVIIGMFAIACSVSSNATSGLFNPTPTLYNAFDGGTVMAQTHLLPTVERLMQSSESCQLPCLWGLRPRETTADDVLEFVRTTLKQEPYLGTQDNGWQYYEAFLGFSAGSIDIVFRIENDVLVRTEIRLLEPTEWLTNNPFLLHELLEALGQPTDVYISYSAASSINYNLAVVYNDIGVMAEYVFMPNSDNVTVDTRIQICSPDRAEYSIRVWLQSEDSEVVDNLSPAPKDTSSYGAYLDIEQMANINIETFTEAFVGVPDGCIEALSLRELREQGYR